MPLDPALDPFGQIEPRLRMAQRLASIEEQLRTGVPSIARGTASDVQSASGSGPTAQLYVPADALVEIFIKAEAIFTVGGGGNGALGIERDGSGTTWTAMSFGESVAYTTKVTTPGSPDGAQITPGDPVASGGWWTFPETQGLHTYSLRWFIFGSGSVRQRDIWARLAR